MKNYELMFIVRPNLESEGIKKTIETIQNVFLTRGGSVTKVTEIGLKDLAYTINKFNKGYYVVMNVVSNQEAIKEYDRVARISEDIIRFIAVKDE